MASDKKLSILKNGIQIIVVLFAAFGGFLLNIAPPGNAIKLSVGIAQFITLCLLLYISAFSVYSLSLNKRRYRKNYRTWLIICGIALILTIATAIVYFQQYNHRVIKIDKWEASYIKGDLSSESLKICKEDKIDNEHGCELELQNNF